MTYTLSADISDKLLEMYLAEPEIAIDTELHGLRLYRDEVCLVQICDDKKNVCLVKPEHKQIPPNLKRLLTDQNVIKVFHFALSDIAFFKTSMNIDVTPFRCTKVMSKLIRTYTQGHGLKDLSMELLGHDLNKDQQQTNWAQNDLSFKQLEYAANDVLELIQIYRKLTEMMDNRPPLSSGRTVNELNIKAQAMLPGLIDLLVNGYGDKNGGWESSLFTH
ncbi:MAG: 3'-5' exonuclease [SAR324 cluster bacterium]|jgi:ribonuclease D|nr:3'-5' exonuclease [SAR324 cluster bacterium]|tara:strand:+ start:39 stop:695 length:657 start_codon:yes stop_codon:yes gene_type:complete